MSTPQDISKSDWYSELGVEPQSTAAEIMARIEAERERSNLLKKIPKRRFEAESRLAHLTEIEHVLLNPSARAAYDARPKAAEQLASAMSAPEQLSTSASGVKPDVEIAHFCTSCGAALSRGASFCEECATPILAHDAPRRDHDTKGPDVPITSDSPIHKSEVPEKSVAEVPETTKEPIPVSPGTKASSGPSPFIFVVPIVLIAVLGAVWFFTRKTSLPVAAPPVPGQVTDLRPPQASLLNHPVLQPSPVASWDTQNIHGPVIIKGEKDTQSIVYPNGAQFVLDAKLFSASGAGSAAFSEEYGTVVVKSAATLGQDSSATWQTQIQVDQAKDINGDGFPEIVLSDYSGGAHCCTTIEVISLRPQGPVVVFDEPLGSDDAVFKDLDGDGRREIRYEHLFEYALGSFAQGTFGVPVIYSAGQDGVYRVNTRAFSQIMSNEYDSSSQEHQKKTYDSSEEEDRDLIDMFFRAYLAGRSAEGFEALGELKPLNGENSTPSAPLAILEDALKKVAPEVLQQPEWARTKSGQPLAPEQTTPVGQKAALPEPSVHEPQPPPPTQNIADIPKGSPSPLQRQPVPAPVLSPPPQPKGVLHYYGPPVHLGERIAFSNLPGARLKFTFDHQLWQPLISRQPDGTQTLTLRSLKQGEQTQCEVGWEIVE